MESIQELREKIRILESSDRELRKELEILTRLSQLVISELNFEHTVSHILEGAKELIPYDASTLMLLEEHEFRVIGCNGYASKEQVLGQKDPYFPEESNRNLGSKAINEGQPIFSNDVLSDFPDFRQPAAAKQIQSWMVIPLIHCNEKIGIISIDSFGKNSFTAHHLELAQMIATPLTLALENGQNSRQNVQDGYGRCIDRTRQQIPIRY